LFAQKAWVADNGTKYPIDAKEAILMDAHPRLTPDSTAVATYLMQTIPNLQPEGSGLKLEHAKKSPKGLHLLFAQTYGARKVFRGSVKVNLRADGQVLSIFDHTFVLPENIDTVFPPHNVYHDGLMVHYNHPENGALERYTLEETYFFDGETLLPTIRLEVVEKQDRYYEMVLNKAVRVIYQNDLITYYAPAPQDSVVTLWVFSPDPITSSQEVYGTPYSDQNDQDIGVVNAERVPRQVAATFDSGIFSLKNSAAEIVEFSDPITTASSSSINEFNYTRTQDGFEDCNVLYHLTTMRDYIHSLGFTDLMDYAIHVDAHALNGSDNSNFNQGFSPPRLSFGEGGVDDAEDADVVVHEYGHAIMHSAAPGSNSGTERRAMDEAIGDYFASSYSRSLSNFGWADVFNWDGHNEFWDGRSTVSTDHYPENLQQNVYTDADIWSATLMQIWGDIGREATDAIMLQAAYSFTSGMTMPQAAIAFIQADTLLFDAAHFSPIRQRMFDRGLIPWNVGLEDVNAQKPSSFRLLGSADFASSNGNAIVAGKAPFTIELVDALGKTIRTANSTADKFTVSSDGLRAGVYILTVRNAQTVESFKVVKN
jgi:hypothetical protein